MVDKEKILAGRKRVGAYLTAHTKLYEHGWHRGIPEEHIPLVNRLLAQLKELGFDSVGEFQRAEREFLPEILVEDFDKQAIQREVRLLDLSQFSFVHNMAALEAISTLRQQDISLDTLVFPHSDIEKQVGVAIAIDADIDSIFNATEAEILGVPFVRMMIPSHIAALISSKIPMPFLFSKDIYDVRIGWELWFQIAEKTWSLLGISVERSQRNDLLVSGKKLTGLWVELHVGLMSGILELDFDLADRIYAPRAGTGGRAGLMPSERLTTASLILKRQVGFQEFRDAFVQSIQEVLHITLIPSKLTMEENQLIAQLMPRYQSRHWTLTGEYNG